MCSVVSNLVTSLEFQPIRCAATLFHFGQTRKGYVATRIILISSTAENSATSGYVVAQERSGQSEAWAGRNVERARRKPSLFPAVDLIDALYSSMKTWTFLAFINFIFCTLKYFPNVFQCFLFMQSSFISCLCYYSFYRRGNDYFNVHFRRIGPVHFPSEDQKDAVREGRDGRRKVYLPPESAPFPL